MEFLSEKQDLENADCNRSFVSRKKKKKKVDVENPGDFQIFSTNQLYFDSFNDTVKKGRRELLELLVSTYFHDS